jgi:hypothetical protein
MKFFTLNSYKEATMKSSLNGRASAISRILLTLTLVLAFFAGDALAQCTGKKVYIKLPSGWPTDRIWVKSDNVSSITLTKEGDWYSFTFPNNSNFDQANKTFRFHKSNSENNDINRITSTSWDVPNVTDNWNCGTLPSESYIYEDLNNPGKTLRTTASPDAYFFYFLPPNDEEWILGRPHLFSQTGIVPLEYDEKCGWYKMVYFNKPVPDNDALIIIGNKYVKTNLYGQLGVQGMQEDPLNWQKGAPEFIHLKSQFGEVLGRKADGEPNPGSIYFLADEGAWHNGSGPIPEQKNRCEYSFAAYVYQRTSYSNTNGFSWYAGESDRAYGICKGLAKPVLENGKMVWNGDNCSPNSEWGNADNFHNAFKETANQNKQYCYNMPFTQRPGGLWEFDAFYLCKDGVTTDYNGTETSGCNG